MRWEGRGERCLPGGTGSGDRVPQGRVGIIEGEYEAYATLVDASGETLSLTLHEELSEGVKLVDLRINEAIFEKDDNTYISINFNNQIREMNEY